MTDLREPRPLSRVELMVLARLSTATALAESDIAKSLHQIGVPLTDAALADCVTATLATLEGRALVATASGSASAKGAPAMHAGKRKASKRAAKPRFKLTETGRFALRNAFELKTTPTWKDMCSGIVPALALGDRPGSKEAAAALGSTEAMIATLLRRDRTLGDPITVPQLCDQVIARALGMPPGAVTPAGIRAYALAMHYGVDNKAELEHIAAVFAPTRTGKPATSGKLDRELKSLAAQLARKQLRADFKNKATMVRALLRHWVSQQDESDDAQRPSTQWSTPLRPSQATGSDGLPSTTPPTPLDTAADTLLSAVRATIPMVGSDGRYGKENVFVSALWQKLARDRRLPDLSLDHFKRWLVAANRDQLVALARADLVDDMDARLVEDSEIEDLGATFHFVIDCREPSSAAGYVHHAR